MDLDLDLAEFLLARIAEDEAVARGATPGPWTNDGGIYAGHPTNEVVDYVYDDNAEHIARWDPARVLAECDAKRRIVAEHPALYPYSTTPECERCEYFGDSVDWPCPTLRALAAVYARHPDYRQEWRP